MPRKPNRTDPHPLGGKVSWFTLTNGRTFTVLGDGYPSEHNDYEVHERAHPWEPDGEEPHVLPSTETRYPTWDAVHTYLDTIETE